MPKKKVTQVEFVPSLTANTDTAPQKRKVAAYARVSTSSEEQETSLSAQREYDVTMLSNSTSSTSTTLAATPYAVKLAYDRSSWTSISLTNALAIAYGGTGSTTAAGARSNLGITCTSLFNGTLTTGNTSFNYGSYKAYIIIGQPSVKTTLKPT